MDAKITKSINIVCISRAQQTLKGDIMEKYKRKVIYIKPRYEELIKLAEKLAYEDDISFSQLMIKLLKQYVEGRKPLG